jgi:hypothetical protein
VNIKLKETIKLGFECVELAKDHQADVQSISQDRVDDMMIMQQRVPPTAKDGSSEHEQVQPTAATRTSSEAEVAGTTQGGTTPVHTPKAVASVAPPGMSGIGLEADVVQAEGSTAPAPLGIQSTFTPGATSGAGATPGATTEAEATPGAGATPGAATEAEATPGAGATPGAATEAEATPGAGATPGAATEAEATPGAGATPGATSEVQATPGAGATPGAQQTFIEDEFVEIVGQHKFESSVTFARNGQQYTAKRAVYLKIGAVFQIKKYNATTDQVFLSLAKVDTANYELMDPEEKLVEIKRKSALGVVSNVVKVTVGVAGKKRDHEDNAIAGHDHNAENKRRKGETTTAMGPLIADHGFGSGFATMKPAPAAAEQPTKKQRTLGFEKSQISK